MAQVRRAVKVLPTCPGLRAAVVSGSLASNLADEFSDVDLTCVVDDRHIQWWTTRWSEVVERVAGPLVAARSIGGPVIGGYSLTSSWEHVDLIVTPASSNLDLGRCRVLYDPGAIVPAMSGPASDPAVPTFPDDLVTLFLYLLGASTVTLGRGELVLAHSGVTALRDQLVKLMLAERGINKSNGQKRLNPYLSDEQRQTLLALPAAEVAPNSIVAAYHAIARDFTQRAHCLAVRTGSAFPDALLAATEAHMANSLGTMWTDHGSLKSR